MEYCKIASEYIAGLWKLHDYKRMKVFWKVTFCSNCYQIIFILNYTESLYTLQILQTEITQNSINA